jgi:hypothetical protein
MSDQFRLTEEELIVWGNLYDDVAEALGTRYIHGLHTEQMRIALVVAARRIAAAAKQPVETFHYTPSPEVTLAQRAVVHESNLISKGDARLVWVNEGDLCRYGKAWLPIKP